MVVYRDHEISGGRRTEDEANASQVINCFLKNFPVFVFYLDPLVHQERMHKMVGKLAMKGVEVGGGHVFFGDPQVYLVQDREKGSEHVELT